MRVVVDTNVIVRMLVQDDPVQSPAAQRLLAEASAIVLTTTVLCETVWVLRRTYRIDTEMIARAIGMLTQAENVVVDRDAVNAGLAHLRDGGDFADGVIAAQGFATGATVFASFDKAARDRVSASGMTTITPH